MGPYVEYVIEIVGAQFQADVGMQRLSSGKLDAVVAFLNDIQQANRGPADGIGHVDQPELEAAHILAYIK